MSSSQGNLNQTLYALARSSPNPLHGISTGNNIVPCQTNPPSTGCPTSGSGAGFMGYSAGAGYSMASGLGSVDALALISDWPSITTSPDFDITVTPPSITVSRGSVATAQIMVNDVGGLTGMPSLSCNVAAVFVNVTCSIAPTAGPTGFTLTLTTWAAAAFSPGITDRPRVWAAQRFGVPRAENAGAGPFSLAGCLIVGGIVICWWGCQGARGKAKLVPLVAVACSVAVLLGCAGATSGGGPAPSSQIAPASSSSMQLTPKSAVLGPNGQQQFTATLANSSNNSVNWSLNPALGTISSGLYTAPSALSANQSVTVTAASIADPTKQASATILLVPQETGTIQVTGNLNGISHTVGISLTVN
jgi:hypothetical protein